MLFGSVAGGGSMDERSLRRRERRVWWSLRGLAAVSLVARLGAMTVIATFCMRVFPPVWTSWVVAFLVGYGIVSAANWIWREGRYAPDFTGRYRTFVERLTGPPPITPLLDRARWGDAGINVHYAFNAIQRGDRYVDQPELYEEALAETLWVSHVNWVETLAVDSLRLSPVTIAALLLIATA